MDQGAYAVAVEPVLVRLQAPCNGFTAPLQYTPAVFGNTTAYKNGLKGAVAMMVGAVQFRNMVLGDNGGGPKSMKTTGKDLGGQVSTLGGQQVYSLGDVRCLQL